MIFRKYTKWIPLGQFTHGAAQSIVMVRGCLKTGEMFFKTKRVNKTFPDYCHPIGNIPINVSEQWDKINQMINETYIS
jgi:hypothetical protein